MTKQDVVGAISDRQFAGLRLLLSLAALFAIYFDPSEPDRFVPLTYAALLLYTLYSACIYYAALQVEAFSNLATALLVSTDVVLYSLLISLSSGTNSIFFFFYFFAIIVASGRLGADAGVAVTAVSTLAFVSVGYFATPHGVHELNRLLLRPASLILLGYVLTYWARAEQGLRRKLQLLREVSQTANPRFGVDRTAGEFMKRVLDFFNADTCVLLEYDRETQQHQLRAATIRDPNAGCRILPEPANIDNVLQAVANVGMAVYTGPLQGWKRFGVYRACDAATRVVASRLSEEASTVAEWLSARSFMVVPLRHHEWSRGYLFVSAARAAAFRMEDARFLLQLADQVVPVLEHIRLVDRMASEAADEERRRIARTVHDRVIQPYLGLQMGLTAVRRLMQPVLNNENGTGTERGREAMRALDHLLTMADEGVEELREYVYRLRNTKARGDALVDSLLRYAAKFETVTGIRVNVVNRLDSADINDRLGGEIFQMAAEALSNVRRHTTTTIVTLTIESSQPGSIAVRIENQAGADTANRDFIPRSISERAESLGGRAQVLSTEGTTIVQVEIPL